MQWSRYDAPTDGGSSRSSTEPDRVARERLLRRRRAPRPGSATRTGSRLAATSGCSTRTRASAPATSGRGSASPARRSPRAACRGRGRPTAAASGSMRCRRLRSGPSARGPVAARGRVGQARRLLEPDPARRQHADLVRRRRHADGSGYLGIEETVAGDSGAPAPAVGRPRELDVAADAPPRPGGWDGGDLPYPVFLSADAWSTERVDGANFYLLGAAGGRAPRDARTAVTRYAA